MDPQQLYLELYKEYRTELRHQESQRSAVSGICIALAGGLIGLMFQQGVTPARPYLGLILVNFSLAAVIMSEKLYERFMLARTRTQLYLRELDLRTSSLIAPGKPPGSSGCPTLMSIWKAGEDDNRKKHPLRSMVRLHSLWEALLIGSGLIGAFLWYFDTYGRPHWFWFSTSLLLFGPLFQISMLFVAKFWERSKRNQSLEEMPRRPKEFF